MLQKDEPFEDKLMSLGAIISALREAHGLSLSEVEEITQINRGALSKFERDLEGLGPQNIDRLCLVFGTTPSVLYAVAHESSKQPNILNDSNRLNQLVKRLTKLIDNYLSTSDDIRHTVDKLLQ